MEYICYTEPPGDWHCIECGELMHAPFYVFEADAAPLEPPDCEMYCELCAVKNGYMEPSYARDGKPKSLA